MTQHHAETQISKIAKQLVQSISQVFIGKEEQVLLTLSCMVAGGHMLLEDVPGLGKTTLAKALAASIHGTFKRVQCTPDLMPSDITGVTIYNQKSGEFEFIKGPVFTNILLADEINRTSPRTQSALLEAMSDATVSIDNVTHDLPKPFFVIATQNPIEYSGTYSLPEAQMDRFMMRLSLGYPSKQSEVNLLRTHLDGSRLAGVKAVLSVKQLLALQQHAQKIAVSDELLSYVAELCANTRQHEALRLGASPRAGLSLLKAAQAYTLLTGGSSVTPSIIKQLAEPVLTHRLIFKNQQTSPAEQMAFFDELLQVRTHIPDNPS